MIHERGMWDFFIAYSTADKPIAEELYFLLAPHAKTFLDTQCLLLGDDWDTELATAQRQSIVTIVLISSNTAKAYYQREEIAAAIALARENSHHHRVVPIYLDETGTKNSTIPYGLRLKEGLRCSENQVLSTISVKLLELLQKLAELGDETDKHQVSQEMVNTYNSQYHRQILSVSSTNITVVETSKMLKYNIEANDIINNISKYFEPISLGVLIETLSRSEHICAFISASIGDHNNSKNPNRRYHIGHYFFVKLVDHLLDYYNSTGKIHLCLLPSMAYYINDSKYIDILLRIQSIWNSCFHNKVITNRIDNLVRDFNSYNNTNILEWLTKQRRNFLNINDKQKLLLDLFRAQRLSQEDEIEIVNDCKIIINVDFDATNIEILAFAYLMFKPSKWFSETWFVSALMSMLETNQNNIQNIFFGTDKMTIIESSKNMNSWEAMSFCCKRFNLRGFPSRAYFKTVPDLINNPMSSSNHKDAVFLYKKLNKNVNDTQIANILKYFYLDSELNFKEFDNLIKEGRTRLLQK